jgi:salicylate hydroxylase
MALSHLQVIIIGGGIAGLAAAIALQKRGARVRVLEQAGAFREVGAGLQISPNGARVLQALGLERALTQYGLRACAVVLRKAASAGQVLRMDLPRDGAGFHLVHRADLVGMLQAALPGQAIQLGTKVKAVTLEGARPSVTLDTGELLEADLLLGADGLNSVLRPAITGAGSPFFTGQVAWRALIPCSGDAPEAQVFMGPGRHLVSYPLRGGSLRNIIAVEERETWAAEGWNHLDDPANLRAAFAEFGGPVPGWLAQVREVHLWGLFRHPVAQTWHSGAAAILGDAAHPTLPFMAQGANMALEDAYSLARTLEKGGDIVAALAGWQAARRPRVARVIEAANRNARNYHLRGPSAAAAHLALRGAGMIAPRVFLGQFGWIYDHDVTA